MNALPRRRTRALARAGFSFVFGALIASSAMLAGTSGTQDAVANGDTRTLYILHEHTKESAAITFKRNGSYDGEALKQLNWILRDWRLDEPTRMEPRLFDIVWEVYREVGAQEPVHVVSAYRSPQTNAMLRRRSRAVSEHSQHMLGKAMDFYLPGVPTARVREVGMRLQEGGVGFYPNAMNPFVHLDAGSVRAWPRMSRAELARLFPDGRTVHLPRDGKAFDGYEEARARILAKGGTVAGESTYAGAGESAGPRRSLWAMLFGGADEDEDSAFYRSAAAPRGGRAPATVTAYAPAAGNSDDAGTRGFFSGLGSRNRPAPLVAAASPAAEEPAPRRGRRVETASLPPRESFAEPAPGFENAGETNLLRPAREAERGGAGAAPPEPETQPIKILAAVPTPPRRPTDLEPLLVAGPLPPVRPVQFAALTGSAPVVTTELNGRMASPPAVPPRPAVQARTLAPTDERQALRALFEAAVTPAAVTRLAAAGRSRTGSGAAGAGLSEPPDDVRVEFSSAAIGTPDSRSFTGPAVAPPAGRR